MTPVARLIVLGLLHVDCGTPHFLSIETTTPVVDRSRDVHVRHSKHSRLPLHGQAE